MTGDFFEKYPSLKGKRHFYWIEGDEAGLAAETDSLWKDNEDWTWYFFNIKDILINCLDKSKVKQAIEKHNTVGCSNGCKIGEFSNCVMNILKELGV